jgi:hypothetical protein
MKKLFVGVVLAAALTGAVVYLLRDYLARSEIRARIQALFEQSNGMRPTLATKDYDLLAFFDVDGYEKGIPGPHEWVEQWKWENGNPDWERKIDKLEVLEHTPERSRVDFTTLEGPKANPARGAAANQTPFGYEAGLVYDKAAQAWKIRSLKRKG